MNQRAKKILTFTVRWGIAIGGIWWVVSNMSLRDSVLLVNTATNIPQRVTLLERRGDLFHVVDPATGSKLEVDGSQVINPATIDEKPQPIEIWGPQKEKVNADLLGMRLEGDLNKPWVRELLVRPEGSSQGEWIFPTEVVGGYQLNVPRPRIEVGILSLVNNANPYLLALAVAVFPTTFLITSYRWYRLLRVAGIGLSMARVFVINMVGAFYNTFMPGSVGGDVFKMYYASKQTPHRTKAIVSVIIDRVLGLLALVMIGGIMAAYQYVAAPNKNDATARACLQVAVGSVLILAGVGLGMAVVFQPAFRKLLGLEWVLDRLPMQRQIGQLREVSRVYRRRPIFMLAMLLITIPVHVTVIISAMLAGRAFGLPISPMYYFTVVPVVVLVGSIPISPQGAGVMEFFAILLTQRQGATVSEAFALTMSIRVVQILWNLTGGLFVLRGGFHAPSESEQREMDEEPSAEPGPLPEPRPG